MRVIDAASTDARTVLIQSLRLNFRLLRLALHFLDQQVDTLEDFFPAAANAHSLLIFFGVSSTTFNE